MTDSEIEDRRDQLRDQLRDLANKARAMSPLLGIRVEIDYDHADGPEGRWRAFLWDVTFRYDPLDDGAEEEAHAAAARLDELLEGVGLEVTGGAQEEGGVMVSGSLDL